MSKRDSLLLIQDILTAVEKIKRYLLNMNRREFLNDDKTIDAVVRNLEIIGEASKQLPESFKNAYSDIAWQAMAGLRNRIVHAYFGIDLLLIWEIIQNDLPILETQLKQIIKTEN
jgi:uncharacterized protein with HEPN domain